MVTLYDSLKNYCDLHKTEMPSNNICNLIGKRIMSEIKKGGKFIAIEKAPLTIFVNNYPDEIVPIVNAVVEKFYAGTKSFFKKPVEQNTPTIKYMNFDIDEKNIEVFEAALKASNIDVVQNYIQKGKAQYKVPLINPVDLIKFGMRFQSNINYARKLENRKKYEQANAVKLLPEPLPKKKVIKRKRKIVNPSPVNI